MGLILDLSYYKLQFHTPYQTVSEWFEVWKAIFVSFFILSHNLVEYASKSYAHNSGKLR